MSNSKGFTLVEIMIALFIFVIVMAIIIAGLNIVIESDVRITKNAQIISDTQKAVIILSRDCQQIINRSVLGNDGSSLPALSIDNSGENKIEFTRMGFVNPFSANRRSTLLRVAYDLIDGRLVRKTWLVLDRVPSSRPQERVLLDNVQSFEVTVLDSKNKFEQPGESSNLGGLPPAVAFDLVLTNGKSVHRVIALSSIEKINEEVEE